MPAVRRAWNASGVEARSLTNAVYERPAPSFLGQRIRITRYWKMVDLTGIEPVTS